MRRIFTLSLFAAALLVASFNSFGQTATCSVPSSPSPSDYRQIAQSQAIPANTSTTYNSPVAVYATTTPPTAIPFFLTLQNVGSGNGTGFSITTTIAWGANPTKTYTCTQSSNLGTPSSSGTTYYFSIQPSVALPQGTNFQIQVSIANGNKPLQVTAFGIDKNASTPAGATLPVKFQSLEAKQTNGAVSLNWLVAAEDNMSGYSVEKSTDGRNFSAIGFVNASGSNSYSFVDGKPLSVSYYRIKLVDVDGRYSYSTVAVVKNGGSSIVLNAFPSPVISSFTIQHGTAGAGSLISVSSEDGRVVRSVVPATGTQETKIDLSSAKSGLYLVRYTTASGETQTLKILKQ